jgi:hypothetical protein
MSTGIDKDRRDHTHAPAVFAGETEARRIHVDLAIAPDAERKKVTASV